MQPPVVISPLIHLALSNSHSSNVFCSGPMIAKLNSLKISTRIALAFALAMPITAYALATEFQRSLNLYRTAEVADRQNAAANALIGGVYNILIERQYINNALQNAQP